MSYETILLEFKDRIAVVTLNRPDKFNSIRPPMTDELDDALKRANADKDVRVIILHGAGHSFCAGFDFSGNLDHFSGWGLQGEPEEWDPGRDMMSVTNPFSGPIPKIMGIWRSPKPVITKVQGWAVGGGSEMALLGDLVIASDDARIGTPFSRVWGSYLTAIWTYRLGLTRAKFYALTGNSISGKEAAQIGLVNFSHPLEELDAKVWEMAERLAKIPVTQLATMKLVTNQIFDNMGMQTAQILGGVLDGFMRHTPEAREFVRTAKTKGVGAAVAARDAPFGDYSQGGPEMKPRRLP